MSVASTLIRRSLKIILWIMLIILVVDISVGRSQRFSFFVDARSPLNSFSQL